MLAFIVACVLVGLTATHQYRRRHHVAVITFAVAVTALYFFVPRFM